MMTKWDTEIAEKQSRRMRRTATEAIAESVQGNGARVVVSAMAADERARLEGLAERHRAYPVTELDPGGDEYRGVSDGREWHVIVRAVNVI